MLTANLRLWWLIAIFGIAYLEWAVYGLKSVALLNRSPWLIFWACVEVCLGAIMGFGFFDAFQAKDPGYIAGFVLASVAGCALGCGTSGAVKWRKR